jgi:hypothetical protein
LFMDVVLLLSHEIGAIQTKVLEWLGMVYKLPIEDVVKQVNALKSHSTWLFCEYHLSCVHHDSSSC